MRRTRATVSGSFRRHMGAVQEAVYALTDAGVEVLSPADPRVVDAFGDFLFVASDRLRAIKIVQSRHLAAIEASDFLWLVAPDGYVGPSAAMELGFALARGVPVFSCTPLEDLTMRQFVTTVPNIASVLARSSSAESTVEPSTVLVDPATAIDQMHKQLEGIGAILLGGGSASSADAEDLLVASAASVRRCLRPL